MDCSVHQGRAALTRCGSCDAPFCDECLPHLVDDRRTGLEMEPWCAACVKELEHDSPWPMPLAFSGMSSLAVFLSLPALGDARLDWVALVLFVVIGVVTWFLYIRGRHERGERIVEPRSPAEEGEEPEPPEVVGYREPARPLTKPLRLRAQLPPVSGKRVSIALVAGIALVGGVTVALGGIGWLSLGVMAGGWWLLWTLTFAAMLHAGRRVADDLPQVVEPATHEAREGASLPWNVAKLPMFLGATGPQSIPIALGLIAILMSVVFVGWVIADLLVAPIFVVGYLGTVTALHHVTREPASYRGKLGRSLGRGAIYALACTLPLAALGAGLVQLAHMLR
jgi:hypothetical protein